MPHDLTTTREDVLVKDAPGAHDMVLQTKYEAPSDADGGFEYDPHKAKDAEVAATMMKWLQKHYPGYPWATACDLKHGIVKFSIPILMGVGHWFVVNLSTHDIVDGLRLGAGEILERYRQRRGRFQLSSFLDARDKHSKLVIPGRPIPN